MNFPHLQNEFQFGYNFFKEKVLIFFIRLWHFVTDPNQQQYYGGQPYPQPGFAPGPQPGYPGGGYPPQQPGFAPGPQPGYPGGGYPPQGLGGLDPGYAGGPAGYGGDANPEAKGFEFNDESIRRGFIRKVYAILMVNIKRRRKKNELRHQTQTFHISHISEFLLLLFI